MIEKKPFFRKESRRRLSEDKRAVSPVIAEILMVAIVVVLAAVISAFVFGGVSPLTTTLDLHFSSVEAHAGTKLVTMTASGSDSITVAVAGTPAISMTELIVVVETNGANNAVSGMSFVPADTNLDAGSRLTITATSAFTADDDVHIVLTDPESRTILLETTVKART